MITEQVLEIHRTLGERGVEHAFGGALALANATKQPVKAEAIELHLFSDHGRSRDSLAALPEAVTQGPEDRLAIESDGGVVLDYSGTTLTLSFDRLPIHKRAARHRGWFPYEGKTLPVIGPTELIVFRALAGDEGDWADVSAILAAGSAKSDVALAQLEQAVTAILTAEAAKNAPVPAAGDEPVAPEPVDPSGDPRVMRLRSLI